MNKELNAETEFNTNERHIVHIINPVSGSGIKFRRTKKRITELGEDIYLTTRKGDGREFIAELLTKDPTAHIVAHGGDGTMGDAACGIMDANAGKTALFTGVPSGSGNDFLHYMYSKKNTFGKVYPTDLILANGRYSINICNMGFDCTVVSEAERIRKIPGITGGLSYIAGVVSTLTKKESFKTTMTLYGVNNFDGKPPHNERISEDFLLAAIANGTYYGGGFMVAPVADTNDGLIDVIAVKNVSVPTFVSLVADFRKGTHIDRETGKVKDKFKNYLFLKKCKKITFDGIKEICYDGEIIKADSISAEIIPQAIRYTPPKKAWLLK